MKINSFVTYKNIQITNPQKNTNYNENKKTGIQTNSFVSYPQNYYVSFGSRNFIDDYSKFKDTEMPTTVRDYIENAELLYSKEEFDTLSKMGLKHIQRTAFADLASCKTVNDVKSKYPNEEDFKDIKPLSQVQTRNDFFSKMKELDGKGIKILSCEEDVTTFLIKKIYLECKLYKDVLEDLKAVITPEAGILKELLAKQVHAQKSSFIPLGMDVPNGTTYGNAIQGSDPNFKREYKPLKNLTPEQVTEKIKKLLTQTEKSRYAMMDAWNNCPEIRFDLSKFLTENYNNPDFFSSLSDRNMDIYDGKFYSKQRNLMIGFWKKYPQYKEVLGKEIKLALERFDKYKAMSPEKFEEYKKAIEARSEEIRNNIQFSKINLEKEFPIAIELINSISQSANPMSIATDSATRDFAQLLIKQMSLSELQTLQSDDCSPEYQKLVPNGMKEKMRSLLKTPEYTNLSNAQNIAILQNLIEEKALDEDDIISIMNAGKTLEEIIEEMISGESEFTKGHTIYVKGVDNRYNVNKLPLNSDETEKVRAELLKFNPNFKEEDNLKLDTLLTTQGKYLKTIAGKNYLRPLTQTLFWNEFDRINGTSYSSGVLSNIKLDKTVENAINVIDNINFSDIEELYW